MDICSFIRAWSGRCTKPAAYEGGTMCDEHASKRCWCGDQAVTECSIAVSLVCGAPLCGEHGCRYDGHSRSKESS